MGFFFLRKKKNKKVLFSIHLFYWGAHKKKEESFFVPRPEVSGKIYPVFPEKGLAFFFFFVLEILFEKYFFWK